MMLDLAVWWGALVLIGLAAEPIVAPLFPASFSDRGRGLAKPLGLIAIGFFSWLLTSAGVPHRLSLPITCVGLAVVGAASWMRVGLPRASVVLQDEATFLAVFGAFAAIRALAPEIFGAEKYMDFALLNTLVRANHFPPQDPWMSGVAVNYYYFGYLLFANLDRLTGIAPAIAYNLSLATIGAMVFCAAVSVGGFLCGQRSAGFLSGVTLVVMGNLDGAQQLLVEHKAFSAFDYWRSTRLVPNTINEFPFFSVVHGDLHPHLMALLIDVSLVGVALATSMAMNETPSLRANAARLGTLALLLGAVALANPWGLPVDLTLIGMLALHRLWDDRRPLRALAGALGAVAALAAVALALSLPFALRFHAQYQGIGRVQSKSPLGAFLVVFGILLLPPIGRLGGDLLEDLADDPPSRDLVLACAVFTTIALYVASQSAVLILTTALVIAALLSLLTPGRPQATSLAVALVGAAAVALAACEVVFLRDSYGAAFQRMNTVFKLYFQAWMLLALAFPALAATILTGARGAMRAAALVVLLVGATASLCYPMGLIASRLLEPRAPLSLDGMAYLDRDHPNDGGAIRWLATQVRGTPVVLETTGDPYSYFARVSSNTGLPTLLGWANHEGVWRGADPRIEQRARDVATLYGDADLKRAGPLLARYHVSYVFIGELERQQFVPEGLDKFARHPELFERVYRSGTTEVFGVRATIASE
jgi:YYY domain-containing protein